MDDSQRLALNELELEDACKHYVVAVNEYKKYLQEKHDKAKTLADRNAPEYT